jgi:hypothetical protein
MFHKPISISVISALMIASSHGATLSNVEGAVSVNQGNGFVPAVNGATAGPGDRVRTQKGSSVKIVYENGAVVNVGPIQVVLVRSTPPAGARGIANPAIEASPEFSPLLAGGLFIGAGAGLVTALSNSSNKPASP